MVRTMEGKHPEYYEAILQLRDISKEMIDFVEEEIVRIKLYISKTIKLKNGKDYYLSDTAMTKKIGKTMLEKYGGEIKITASLFGKKKGKELYRTTILFRGIPFHKGDRVKYLGEEYEIKILSKDILMQNNKTGEKIHVRYEERKKINLI